MAGICLLTLRGSGRIAFSIVFIGRDSAPLSADGKRLFRFFGWAGEGVILSTNPSASVFGVNYSTPGQLGW